MPSPIESIAKSLNQAGIKFNFVDTNIHVPLPNNFDTLVIEIWNDEGEDSITLLNGNFHTHGDIEANEYGLPSREAGICNLIESVFNGTFKMVKRKNHKGEFENTIWDTFSLALIDKIDRDKFEIISED